MIKGKIGDGVINMITSMRLMIRLLIIRWKTSRETPALARRRPIGWSRRTSSSSWVRSEWTCKYTVHFYPQNTYPGSPDPENLPNPHKQCWNSICQNCVGSIWFCCEISPGPNPTRANQEDELCHIWNRNLQKLLSFFVYKLCSAYMELFYVVTRMFIYRVIPP